MQPEPKRIKLGVMFIGLTLGIALIPTPGQAQAARITDTQILQNGQQLFIQNCAACHGQNAQGLAKDWKQAGVNGKYPPPPLNGTAHTWHICSVSQSVNQSVSQSVS